nr:cell wall-binding repeat-containing protein [uncultured Peptostreptococcus sp.]
MKLKKRALSLVLSLSMLTCGLAYADALSYNEIQQIRGIDRYATASGIAGEYGLYDSVILVNADKNKLADGLSASGLAGVIKAPILLVHRDSIPNETQLRMEIAKKIYIIGSDNSISSNIENKLRSQGGFTVKRIGGDNRYDTSNNVAREILNIKGSVGKVFIANGSRGEADAMSISAVAARDGEPILLTNGFDISDTARSISETTKNVYAIGGVNSISTGLVNSLSAKRVSGNSRFLTNSQVIRTFYKERPYKYLLSDGYKLVDALTGGPLAGRNNAPIVLVNENNDKSVLKGAGSLVSLGGISQSVLNKCAAATNR